MRETCWWSARERDPLCRPSLLINPEGRKIEKENKREQKRKKEMGKGTFTYSGIAEIKRRGDRLKLDKGLKALSSKERPVKICRIL